MKIYHFCADKLLWRILKDGLTMGGVVVPEWMHAYDMHTRWHNMCGILEDHPADEPQQEGGAVPDE